MKQVGDASIQAAKDSVTLAIGLIGVMALWLGLVRVLEAGGLMKSIARAIKPVMTRLFRDVPPEHPAMGAMVLNMSANMLGLGNAATPFGIKAMIELNKLNSLPGTATNAMCLFLAINTSSVTLFPLGAIAVRMAAGSAEPANIFLPTLIATICSTVVAIILATLFARLDKRYLVEDSSKRNLVEPPQQNDSIKSESKSEDYSHLQGKSGVAFRFFSYTALAAFLIAIIRATMLAEDISLFLVQDFLSLWLMPALMLLILCYGLNSGVRVYEAVTDGAKQGFEIAIKIIPYLVAILVAIAMFRASGAMDFIAMILNPLTSIIGMPAEVLPMALVRPLSGSGAFGVMSALTTENPNSYSAYLSAVMMGSTETTFYVLAVYFGAVGVSRIRHALVCAICADVVGIVVACLSARAFWSGIS
jgi:spore maturation protein SpmA